MEHTQHLFCYVSKTPSTAPPCICVQVPQTEAIWPSLVLLPPGHLLRLPGSRARWRHYFIWFSFSLQISGKWQKQPYTQVTTKKTVDTRISSYIQIPNSARFRWGFIVLQEPHDFPYALWTQTHPGRDMLCVQQLFPAIFNVLHGHRISERLHLLLLLLKTSEKNVILVDLLLVWQ